MTFADPSPRWVITIDTETYAVNGTLPPFETNIYGLLDGRAFGVQRIIDICNEYQAPATFFVDVYMHHHYGAAPVRELCQLIDSQGHDVQLHAHTQWLPGSTSNRICDFPRAKQASILAEGRDLIDEWIGKPPKAFRAGAYNANMDTIHALEATGFALDSSYFAYHRGCPLSAELGNPVTNKPFRIGTILEIPVTCYWLLNRWRYRKLSKLDVNACSAAELCSVSPQFVRGDVACVVLFLHSFSFIKWQRNGRCVPNYRAVARFEQLLECIRRVDPRSRFVTAAELAADFTPVDGYGADLVPRLNPACLVPRAFNRLLE